MPQKSFERLAARSVSALGLREAEQLEVAVWKTNASASVNAVFGTPASSVVVDVVERERLLDVVAHLVDRDVVALVVHAVRADARAQVRRCRRGAPAPQRVAGAARRIDDDVLGEELRALRREAELREEVAGCRLVYASAVG